MCISLLNINILNEHITIIFVRIAFLTFHFCIIFALLYIDMIPLHSRSKIIYNKYIIYTYIIYQE